MLLTGSLSVDLFSDGCMTIVGHTRALPELASLLALSPGADNQWDEFVCMYLR